MEQAAEENEQEQFNTGPLSLLLHAMKSNSQVCVEKECL